MTSLLDWIKRNKLAAVLLLIVGFYLAKQLLGSFFGISNLQIAPSAYDSTAESYDMGLGAPSVGVSSSLGSARSKSTYLPPVPPMDPASPQTGISDRMVVQNSQLALVVKNVRQAVDQITSHAIQAGGYMVNSNLSQPEEAPYAVVSVRVPSDQLANVLSQYRGLAVKVTYENLTGHDVTDQYLDIDTRLERLRKTKAKFEELLDSATSFDQILRAQQEVINMQNQIDNLIGQQQYLEQTSRLALVTINLSTDELALPYAPTDTFRPAVIFKQAVRSLVLTLRSLFANVIWLAVYSVIWLPALLIIFFTRRWWLRRSAVKKTL